MKRASIVLHFVAASSLTFAGCQQQSWTRAQSARSGQPPSASAQAAAPRFSDIGRFHRKVSTSSKEAQKYFDQALTWTFAFNHDEAIRSFYAALDHDPKLAIAWWGIAYCHGPHINFPMLPEKKAEAAWNTLQKAKVLKFNASPVEQALIDALSARYVEPTGGTLPDRAPLDRAFADAMKRVHEKFPDDSDVAVLYAESLMDLQPWDLWTNDGKPKGNAPEIVRVLESVLRDHPNHPGATHFYIHAVEASPEPGKALASADTLLNLVPISGHLSHMPSHIYARVGQWDKAVNSNRKAIAADKKYRELSPKQGFYMAYMQHNHGFLSFACMMDGRSREAIAAGHDAVNILPAEWIKENAGVIDGYLTVHMDALKRFGKWDEILALPEPPKHLPFTSAMWRANRAIAFAAKGNIDEAASERALFERAVKAVPQDAMAQKNTAHDVLKLATHVVDGEIAYARRDYQKAISELTTATELEDNLRYIEPPDWMVPVRHTLGAVYLDAGKAEEAERTYREDLARLPNNGWSLLGLTSALDKQGKTAQAEKIREQYKSAWANADFKPHSSCMCTPTASEK